jgi:beta-lactamase regulating signal transducer with metallopeptidase domain
MHEHITRALYYFEIHLLYSSVVGVAALVLTSIRGGSATTKYWIWVATSLNFIMPVGALLDKLWAPQLSWAAPLGFIGGLASTMSRGTIAIILSVIWFFGAMFMIIRLCSRIRAEHRGKLADAGRRHRGRAFVSSGVPVSFAASGQPPAVDGVLHPHICLPYGIDRLLSEHELNAVLIHEVAHARRRDNLICLVYELGRCALWFHPLMWITGSRLALYRELSCDESVIRSAHGEELVSALAKLAVPEKSALLQASASSFMSHRLARLTSGAQPTYPGVSMVLSVGFSAILLWGIFGTVAHTACCFIARR